MYHILSVAELWLLLYQIDGCSFFSYHPYDYGNVDIVWLDGSFWGSVGDRAEIQDHSEKTILFWLMPWSHNHWVLDTYTASIYYLVTMKSKWDPLELAKRNEPGALQSQNHSTRWCKTHRPKPYRCADDAKARLSDAVSPGIGTGWQPDVEALHRTDWLSLQPQPPAMLDGKTSSYWKVFFFGGEFPNPLSSWSVDQRELVGLIGFLPRCKWLQLLWSVRGGVGCKEGKQQKNIGQKREKQEMKNGPGWSRATKESCQGQSRLCMKLCHTHWAAGPVLLWATIMLFFKGAF